MKRIISQVFVTSMVLMCHAQQDPYFSQSMFNIMMYNPGYAGSRDAICASAINRQQWMGLEGAPVTSLFAVNSPFRILGADHGAGLHILNDVIGFENNLSLNLSYAYRMNAGPGKLGIGLGFGIINSELDADWIFPSGSSSNPAIPVDEGSALTMDFSAGMIYYTEEFYLGFSSTHINKPLIEYNTTATHFLNRHYYLTAGYTIYFENPAFKAHPALLIHTDGAMMQLNLGGIIDYENKLWGGIFYRHESAVIFMAGFELFNNINIGYSFDLSTTAIRGHNKGTHEFMLGYCFELDMDRGMQRYRSIRIL